MPNPLRVAAVLCPLVAAGIAGCSPIEGRFTADANAKLDGAMTMKFEGPIVMQMQGPTVHYEGTFVSKELAERIEVNRTRTDWLLAVIGEPNAAAALDDGTEIWKWSYRPTEQTSSVVSVFGGGSKDEPRLQPVTTYVRLRNGVVIERWRD